MKKKPLLLAYDMSSFMWRGLLARKDSENGKLVEFNGKEVLINSAIHGFENVLEYMMMVIKDYRAAPIDCILVFEGVNSKSKRLLINKTYKAGSEKPPEQYEQFGILRDMLTTFWKDLGAQVMWQDFAEGDDTCAYLAKHSEEDIIIATYDNDLAALNGVNEHGAKVQTWIDGMRGVNKYGLFDHHLITTYKALVGDSSDKIKGCPGFGPAKFEALVNEYGFDGLQEIHSMLEKSNLSPLAHLAIENNCKLLRMISDQAPEVINSFDLARLRPDWVNTMRNPLHWQAGMVRPLRKGDDPRFKAWYGASRLVTAATFEGAIEWAMTHILKSPFVALDFETTTPDESDEWLMSQGKKPGEGVDVFASTLCGMGLTFGVNNQYSLYFSMDHADTDNIDPESVRQFVASIPKELELVIQNVSFELCVAFNAWADRQLDNGYHGYLPNVLDTAIEASYVDENSVRGLKQRSLSTLGYRQQTFEETTKLTGPAGTLPKGGRWVSETYKSVTVATGKVTMEIDAEGQLVEVPVMATEPVLVGSGEFEPTGKVDKKTGEPVMKEVMHQVVDTVTRQYKMHELTAEHVFGYGVDDTICTAALHNYYKLFMQLEHSYKVYLAVEIDAAYMHAVNFTRGCDISIEKVNELAAEDTITYDNAWAVVRSFLIENGWAGVAPPTYTVDITPAQIKEAYTTVTGLTLDTMMRTNSKLVTFIDKVAGNKQFAGMLDLLVGASKFADLHSEDCPHPEVVKAEKEFTNYVRSYFKGEPDFNDDSPKQMQKLMYEVMGLPIRVRNKATDTMRANGIYDGTPKTDTLAINYAMLDCSPEHKAVLEALKLMAMVGTRRSLYYDKYPNFPHWKDGKVRSQHNQASTNTRRASEQAPNKQQLPKASKIEGQLAKFREVVIPHRPGAVIVSMDFDSQEMVLIAEQSQDPNMLSCFEGDERRSPHTITGLGIFNSEENLDWSYEEFNSALHDKTCAMHDKVKAARKLGKLVNFVSEYLAMAPKVAQTLMISEEKAQLFLDAREAMFPVAGQWKEDIIREVKEFGVVRTMLGGVRHLRDALNGDRWEASKAERQAVNFKVQGPAAEQTKLAEGRMWTSNLFFDFDAVCIGPIHDEVCASVLIEDLPEFLPRMHACMVAKYANMALTPVSTISFGLNFYRQIEIGAEPTLEAIEKGLEEMLANSIGSPRKVLWLDLRQCTVDQNV